jgi:hypothetical protein
MITREELSALVEQISEDQLDLAFEEQTEFVIPYRPSRRINLPIRSPRRPSDTVTMTIEEASPEYLAKMQQFHENIEWWDKHRYQIAQDDSLANQFIAISQGEVLAGSTYLGVREKALKLHPQDTPYIFFLYPRSDE